MVEICREGEKKRKRKGEREENGGKWRKRGETQEKEGGRWRRVRNEGRVKESTCRRREGGKGERGSVVREESRKEG